MITWHTYMEVEVTHQQQPTRIWEAHASLVCTFCNLIVGLLTFRANVFNARIQSFRVRFPPDLSMEFFEKHCPDFERYHDGLATNEPGRSPEA
ncbi:MAG TPA: hypothetical protein EYQ50_09570 [Verrucomicrobiales bacterium]|nr:hypothetical protein [Verrucomicrobiales bacterium]